MLKLTAPKLGLSCKYSKSVFITPRQFVIAQYSTGQSDKLTPPIETDKLTSTNQTDTATPPIQTDTQNDQPWYLKLGQDQRSILKTQQQQNTVKESIHFPKTLTPSNTLTTITNFMNDKLGLSNIIVFDMKNIDHSQINGKVADIIILSTALSMKHCHNSYIELNQLLKTQYNILPTIEGKLNSNDLKKLQRRFKRKNIKVTNNNNNNNTNTNGFGMNASRTGNNEAWYMIDCKVERIIVNILTNQRRMELNLEELYAPLDEKYKYQTTVKPNVEPATGLINDDQSILAGLKRLANQRRSYSTSTIQYETPMTKPNLSSTNVEYKADTVLNGLKSSIGNLDLKMNHQESLEILSKTIETLNNTSMENIEKIDLLQWKKLLDTIWPLILPTDSNLFWSKRFEFLTLLNMIDPNEYQTSRLVKDYFLIKRLSDNKLTRQELIDFLKLNIVNLGINKGKGLLTVNEVISQVLPLYNDDNAVNIATDSELVNLLFQTLVNDQNIKLNSLHSVIEYILIETQNKPDPLVIIPMLRSLAQAKKWNEYFNLWINKLHGVEIGHDYRPWEQFIQYIVESDDQRLMYQLIKDGQLLWLLRYKVNITPAIEKQLNALFDKLDPQREHFKDLESSLLNTPRTTL